MIRRSKALPSLTYALEHDCSAKETLPGPLKKALLSADMSKLNKCVSRFMGHATETETPLPKMPLDVKVTPAFRCSEDPEAFVLSVCPAGAEKLAVSYSTSSDHTEGVTKSFFENGQLSKSFDFGLCTLMRHGNGVFFPCPYLKTRLFGMTYRFMWSKSGTKHALVYNYGTTWSLVSTFNLPSPFCKIFGRCLPAGLNFPQVDALAPLAFDVTKDGGLLAIVDVGSDICSPLENNLTTTDRVVRLISFSGEYQHTDHYKPPAPDFLPSDVCFFTLQGQTVLLVSDLATSSIHVLAVSPLCTGGIVFRVCRFQRYLVADCETMEQPTALNTDEKGHLWVACKGGQLLTVEPTA